jgi:hypothetical protein
LQKQIPDSKKEYLSHDTDTWRLDYFDKETGGYLVTHRQRIEHSKLSKNEKDKFEKEFSMSMVYAKNGYRIELLEEVPRIPSPDVTINGNLGDLKRLSGHNNIVKEAKNAVRKQGAEVVLFEFLIETKEIHKELEALKKEEIKGFYFFTDRKNNIFEI